MNEADWARVRRDKEAFRERNASRPFAEKLAQLDRLRERSHAMKGDVIRRTMATDSEGGRAAPKREK